MTPWTAVCQASLSITNSRSLLKLMSIESVMPSKHLIFCCPLLLPSSVFPSIRVFSCESVLHIRWPSTGVSALLSVLPMNIQVPPQGIHINNVFELFKELKGNSSNKRKLAFFIQENIRIQEPEKLIKRLPETRLKEFRPYTHPKISSNPILGTLL